MIIAVLHCEKKIQIQDLTRFDASRSVLVKGSVNPINSVKIKAGLDSTEVDVFAVQPKDRFLDWVFDEYKFDVDADDSEISFEANGVQYTTNVLTGTYTLANLLTAIKNSIEAVASPLVVTFAVDERNRIKTTPSLPLKFQPNKTSKDLLTHLGFKEDGQLISNPVEYGLRKVTLTVASISESKTISQFVEVYTPEGDSLFSNDSDLISEEPDIMKWLPAGRASYLDLHRKAQGLILDWLDRQGYVDEKRNKLTKFSVIDKRDVQMWSYYLCLRLFFMGVQNAKDDVFKDKAAYYEKLEIASRTRAILNLDLDGDFKEDAVKGPAIGSGTLFLR